LPLLDKPAPPNANKVVDFEENFVAFTVKAQEINTVNTVNMVA
jgi:hypothetical protein